MTLHETRDPSLTPRRPWRWWGTAAGMVTGFADAFILNALGISFSINGSPATFWVGSYFGISFAILGYLVGHLAESRRREREATRRLQEQAELIHRTRERLLQNEKLAALGELAAAVAHEVRNPLGVIRSAAQEIGDGPPEAGEVQRACRFVIEEIDRLNRVIEALLAFVRPVTVTARPVAVRDLFDSALLLAGSELRERSARVTLEADPALVVEADPDLLRQVLIGLLGNAARVVPARGEVRLAARAVPPDVEIEVSDSGPGVPPELRGRVFEPFVSGREGGTGLGLAIARQIVRAHGGEIAVGDRPGGGARFFLTLPALRPAAIAA